MSSYNNIYKPIQFTKLEAIDALNKSLTKKANKDIGKEIKEGDENFSGNMRYDKFLQALEKLKRDGTYDVSPLAQSISNSGTTDNFWEELERTTKIPQTNTSYSTTTTTINNNNFDQHFLDWLKSWEGGYTNIDGGTNKGVTLGTWKSLGREYARDYNNDNEIDENDLKQMTDKDWIKVVNHFKNQVRFSEIKDKDVAQLMFQFAWGSGVQGGIRSARRILGLPDGDRIDDRMLERLNQNPQQTFEQLKEGRRQFLTNISQRKEKQQYKNGWMKRLDSMHYNQPWELNK